MRMRCVLNSVFAGALLCGVWACSTTYEQSGTPVGIEPLQTPLAFNSIYMFDKNDFDGNVTRLENVTAQPAGRALDVGAASDSMSSLKWNLPPGVAVVLYQDAGPGGRQALIWGQGQAASLRDWAFNNRVSRWAWYNVGTAQPMTVPISLRPMDARPTMQMPSGTIELYEQDNLKGNMTLIGPINRVSEGDIRNLQGKVNDSMTSLRWNLPPGVVAILYENADGTGQQLAIWGSGEYSSVSPWDFNDKVSSWAWYDLARSR